MRERRFARALSDIAHALESAEGAPERIARTLTLLGELVPYRRCALLTSDRRGPPRLYAVPEPSAEEAAELTGRLTALERFVVEEVDEPALRPSGAYLALPVIGLDDVIGMLWVEAPAGGAYDESSVELLSIVAAQLGAYLTTLRLHDETNELLAEQLRNDVERERLIAIVSHDLRSPVSAITIAANRLKRATLAPAEAHMAALAARAAERMDSIIRQLLDFARARVGGGIPIVRQPTDLDQVCRQVIEGWALSSPERTVRYHSDGPVTGAWDRDRLSDAIDNLLGNALKHGDPATPIDVTVRGDGGRASVVVHNLGEPIAADLLPHIFDPYRRGAPNTRDNGGLGLGLYIVHAIAVAHGGTVEVLSTREAGTTFTLTLPRAG